MTANGAAHLPESPTIFVTAGEASGDTHAGNLIRALAERLPVARFVGVGGPRMAETGCELLADVTAFACVGVDVLHQVPYFWGVVQRVRREMVRRRASVLVPTDSTGMNWHTTTRLPPLTLSPKPPAPAGRGRS